MPEKKEIEYYTWADKIVGELKNRDVKEHILHGMWTPSGYFHIGNARNELMAPLLVHDALGDAGVKSVFNFFIDDFDDLDKIPAGTDVPEGFEKNLGHPLHKVPSPSPGRDSWSDFFSAELLEVIDKLGKRPKIYSSYKEYHKGTYDNAIRIVLNNWQKARDIWIKTTKTQKPKDWIPVMPICENCGRGAMTVATEWNGETLKYSCSQNRPYAESCGYGGEFVPEKGRVKLPWRLHWPATWFTFRTTFESGGKDHFASGGSVDTGRIFSREIFKYEPPILLRGDFVTVDGKKISGSEGNVVSLKDWLGIAEPELLRFIYISYQPSVVIEFDISSNKFFLLTDRYDDAERCYFGEHSTTEKRTEHLKRQYRLAQITKPPEEQPVRISYSMLVMLLQVVPNKSAKSISNLLFKMGTIKKELEKEDMERLERRIRFAENWLNKYAHEEAKIKINEAVPLNLAAELTEEEKSSMHELDEKIGKLNTESELQSEIYEIARRNNIEPKRFFRILYNLLLNRDSGPKLGPFILATGKEKVSKLLEDVR